MGWTGPRGALPGEVPAVVDLANAIFGRGKFDMGAGFPTLFSGANAEWLRTFWDGGVAVSHVGVWRGEVWTRSRRLTVAHLGAVCTRSEHRGRGLAWALLVDAVARLQQQGVALLLISGDRGLYRRLGARTFGRLLRYRVGRQVLHSLPLPAVPVTDGADLGLLERLYGAEPLRYVRSEAEWRLLMPAKGYTGGRAPIAAGGAYVLVGSGDGATLPVDEFAGTRPDVLVAVRAALERSGADTAVLVVQPGDAELLALLGAAGLSPEPVSHQGTIRALDMRACARALGLPAPGVAGEVGEEAEAEAAARWTEWLFAEHGLELPRNDGLQYI